MSAGQAILVAEHTRSRRGYGTALWLLTVFFLLGIAGLIYGLTSEAARPDWGLLTVTFLFLMGISQAGVVFSAIMRLVGAQWSKPYHRLAEISTLAFFPLAILGFLVIYFFGRHELFYWLSASPDEHLSPWLDDKALLIRNLLALLLFYGLSAVYLMKALAPDLASGSDQDHKLVERQLYLLSPVVLLGFVICNTLIAWDFGMMPIPHWHSTVFPIFYWFGNVFAGTAALVLFPGLLVRPRETSPFGVNQIRSLGMVVTGFTLMWLYFFWAQFFVIWFGNLPHETEPLWRQMYGHYAPYYWVMMFGCFFIPFGAFIFAVVKRSLVAMCIVAFGINVGIWVSKYLMVVPALSPDHQPFNTWLDVSLSVGLLAGFLAAVLLLAKRLPMFSHWEMSFGSKSDH